MQILTVPDKRLNQCAVPVAFAGGDAWSQATLGRTIMLMLDAMYLHHGIGLAAPQVGLNVRLIVVDTVGERHQARVCINPEIVWRAPETEVDVEGCLSVPGELGLVARACHVRVRYVNRDGLPLELDTRDIDTDAEGTLLARVLQHECDHLDGILFTEKLAP